MPGYLVAIAAPGPQPDTCSLILSHCLVIIPLYNPSATPASELLPINLAEVNAAHLVRILAQPHLRLLVDCGTLPCQRTLGICYLVSQLLVLRQSGASVWLCNTSPVLRHCLQKLKLSAFFSLAD